MAHSTVRTSIKIVVLSIAAIILFFVGALFLLLLHLENSGNIEQEARSSAGNGAIDCGRAKRLVPEQRDTVRACAVAAFKSGRPFYALLEVRGFDGMTDTNAMVRDEQGNLYYFERRAGPFFDVRLSRARCMNPRIIGDSESTQLSSTSAPAQVVIPWGTGGPGPPNEVIPPSRIVKGPAQVGCDSLGPLEQL